MNLKINNGMTLSIKEFEKEFIFKMTKEGLLDLRKILVEFDDIPFLSLEKDRDEYLRNERIRDIYQNKWRKNKLLKMNAVELIAFGKIFITTTLEFNMYLSRADKENDTILIFDFTGEKTKQINVFSMNTSTFNFLTSKELADEIIKQIDNILAINYL